MSYNLFLDDLRDPKDAFLYNESKTLFEKTRTLDWMIVRDYDEFVSCIEQHGIPKIVSFDHDLHFEHVRYFVEHTMKNDYIEYASFVHKTGKHCAEYLVLKANKQMPM